VDGLRQLNYSEQEENCSWFYIVEYVTDAIVVEGQQLQTSHIAVQHKQDINTEKQHIILKRLYYFYFKLKFNSILFHFFTLINSFEVSWQC